MRARFWAQRTPMTARPRDRAEPILSARGIINRFGRQEVHDRIGLDILPGEIVGIAGIISLFQGPAKLFGLVGLYSYGLYLIHQPYVIWLGLRIRDVPIWMFLLICIPTLAVLSAWGMLLEKATNTLANKLVSLRKPARA